MTGRPVSAHPVPFPPVEPPPSEWALGQLAAADDDDLVAAGADLEPGTLVAAYRAGLFPMGLGVDGARPIGWWSPEPRGVLVPAEFRERRSLRQARGRFEVRVDTAFTEVMRRCADPAREGRWITDDIVDAYTRLHRLGWAHSVETWRDGELVGGLYGVAIGGLFAGESMFHAVRDASKVALAGLVDLVRADGDPRRIIDVQWSTDHLARLGVAAWPRERYLAALATALEAPPLRFG
ncbi:leucyl/phenylalanyl-tRNA--protein transferase [Knoellia remsis]|uniref:Leucyl/phenylalanyl-tRNA--protein transferase n=1 Tax=Knoellia remsis TaxID=407159 RepID=A0A2T0UXL9_9MICO|nr:leucyl/phenylalanyl-tRNA--protein transferase [Knoellia remsis]